MENIQINGQKIWGPPRDWTGPPPQHGTEIYVKNLPDDVNEIELFQIFSIMGRIYEVRLPVHWSGANRGYAFIRYTEISEADASIKAFDMYEIRPGRALKIERSVDNTRLFLSCVPNDKTAEDIQNELQTVVDNVKKVYVYPTMENPSMFRGYAFVEFKSHRDAAIAKRILTPDVCFNLFEKKCVAAWANPLPFLNENILKTINILFMRNVPKEVRSTTIKKVIETLLGDNALQKVKRLNDFAFLTFKNHEYAKAALNIIQCNPDFLGDGKIQVEWAVPKGITNNNAGIIDNDVEKNINCSLHRLKLNDSIKDKNDFDTKKMIASHYESDANKSISTKSHISCTDLKKQSVLPKEIRLRKIIKNSSNLMNHSKNDFPTKKTEQKGEILMEPLKSLLEHTNLKMTDNYLTRSNAKDGSVHIRPLANSRSVFPKRDSLIHSDISKFPMGNSYFEKFESDLEISENDEELVQSSKVEKWVENLAYSSSSSSSSHDSSNGFSNCWSQNKRSAQLIYAKGFLLDNDYSAYPKFEGAQI